MKVVLALRTRDQIDLVDAILAFHLNAGIDFVIATDHASVDGTAEVLERYEREGFVRLLRETGEAITLRRSEMARLAAAEHGADWVLHADGDEFWWPRGGSVADVLASVPERYGVVRAAWHHFAPRPEDGRHFAERMIVRVSPHAAHTRLADPFHPQVKVAHRAHPQVVVTQGGHDAEAGELRTLRNWYPFEVLHFPLRSLEQSRAKYMQLRSGLAASGLDVSRHVARAYEEIETGGFAETYRSWLVDDEALERRSAEGSVALDTRLRDALRRLAGVDELSPGQGYPLPDGRSRLLEFPVDSHSAAAAYAHDTQPLHELDAETRLHERVSELEGRVRALERGR